MSLFAVLLASFLGSSHCAAMCGGFVAFYSCQSGSHDKVSSERHSALLPRFAHQFAHRFAHHAAYHCGRLLTYSLLGALAGIVGGSLDSLGILLGIQRISTVLAAALLIFWGTQGLLHGKSFGSVEAGLMKKFTSLFNKLFPAVSANDSASGKALALGVLSTFLPCGWLYAFVAVAAATAHPLWGMLSMMAFWLGTVPALVAVAGVSRLITAPLHKYVPRITALLLIAAGLFALSGHYDLMPIDHHH